MSLRIAGGRVIDPANGLDQQADVLIEEGRISQVAPGQGQTDRVLDAGGCLVVPGLVDLHVHLREPGQEHKEDIDSGTRAAAAGGFTSVCCMPNTTPVNDTRAVTESIVERARQLGRIRVYPVGAISRGLEGKALCEYADMKEAGIVAVSDDGRCVMNASFMRRALEYACTFGLPLIQHCEDHHLSAGASMTEGPAATRAGLSAQPAEAEAVIVARDLELVRLTGARYHAAHVSTARALDHLRRAKAEGLPVTCEATPHHLTLTDEACLSYDTRTKVNPPLRSAADRDALRAALADGTVDVIATDHAPHAQVDKEVEYGLAAFGISGLETALPLVLELWRTGVVSLERLIALLTINPARAMGLDAGTLSVGAVADVTVIDPELTWIVESRALISKGKNTPFDGWTMRGAARFTIAQGQLVHER